MWRSEDSSGHTGTRRWSRPADCHWLHHARLGSRPTPWLCSRTAEAKCFMNENPKNLRKSTSFLKKSRINRTIPLYLSLVWAAGCSECTGLSKPIRTQTRHTPANRSTTILQAPPDSTPPVIVFGTSWVIAPNCGMEGERFSQPQPIRAPMAHM